jgi:hypothetical protein
MIAGDDHKPVGWHPVPKENLPKPTIPPADIKTGLNEVRKRAEKPILQKLLFV